MERAEKARHVIEPPEYARRGRAPDRLGLELGLRQLERYELEALLRLDRLLLVADHLLGHDDTAEIGVEAEPPPAARGFDDHGRRLLLRLRVVVALERLDDSCARGVVELEDAVALAEVEVDGAFVHRRVGAFLLRDPEDGTARGVDDRERLRARRAE